MLRSKAGRSQNWLPTQVVYGVDTSDPNPENWKPFGQLVEELEAQKAKAVPPSGSKAGVGLQAARE